MITATATGDKSGQELTRQQPDMSRLGPHWFNTMADLNPAWHPRTQVDTDLHVTLITDHMRLLTRSRCPWCTMRLLPSQQGDE
jgi:hypothetical protein